MERKWHFLRTSHRWTHSRRAKAAILVAWSVVVEETTDGNACKVAELRETQFKMGEVK